MAVEFGKVRAKLEGSQLILWGIIFGLTILATTLVKGAVFSVSPSAFLLVYIIPIIFIEAGLYRYLKSKSFTITEIDINKTEPFNRALNTYSLIYETLISLRFFILMLIFLAFFGYLIFKFGINFTPHFFYTLVFLVIYFTLIRYLLHLIYTKLRASRHNFLANPAFWISLIFIIFGAFLIISSLIGVKLPGSKVSSGNILLIGVGVILVSCFLLYNSLKGGCPYMFIDKSLILFIPYNFSKKFRIEIPFNLIKNCKSLSYAEASHITSSVEMITYKTVGYLSDIVALKKGGNVIPRYWVWGSAGGNDFLFLEGKGFMYVLKVDDADAIIKKIKKF